MSFCQIVDPPAIMAGKGRHLERSKSTRQGAVPLSGDISREACPAASCVGCNDGVETSKASISNAQASSLRRADSIITAEERPTFSCVALHHRLDCF